MNTRLRRLEVLSVHEPCPKCGFDGDYSKIEIKTRVSLLGESPAPGPDRCPACGRTLVFRMPGLSRAGVGESTT